MARIDGREQYLSALRIVLLYAVFAGLWIYFSDTILGTIVRNPEAYIRFSVMKGFLFIAVTGTFLYFLIARNIGRIRTIASALAQSDARFRSYVESAPIAIMVFDADGCCIDYNPARSRPDGHGHRRHAAAATGRRGAGGAPRDDGKRGPGPGVCAHARGRRAKVDPASSRAAAGGAVAVLLPGHHEARERRGKAPGDQRAGSCRQRRWKRSEGSPAAWPTTSTTSSPPSTGTPTSCWNPCPQGRNRTVFLQEIRKAAVRAASLTQQLLAFSRRQTLLPRPVDMNDLLRNLQPMLARLIGEDVKMSLDLVEGLWRVRVDPARVEQALVNLAVNARDAMPRGGSLVLSARNVVTDGRFAEAHPEAAEGEYVAVTVADNGVGMDAETLSHLFEPFYTTKDVGKGTGLGLASVYGIVKQSGGVIGVQSEQQKGSTFTMYLPRLTGEPGRPGRAGVLRRLKPREGASSSCTRRTTRPCAAWSRCSSRTMATGCSPRPTATRPFEGRHR